jgi:hypothetical protein
MLVLSGFILLAAFSIVSFRPVTPVQQQQKFKNLKVLPADITFDSLDHIMDRFKVDLGVKCGYCHAPSKDNPRRMDMASDANPKKDICRDMMRMTSEMNKKYISAIPHADTVTVQQVTCNTCHRGQPKPMAK